MPAFDPWPESWLLAPQELPADRISRPETRVAASEIAHRRIRARETEWDDGAARIMSALCDGADYTRESFHILCALADRKSWPAAVLAYDTLAECALSGIGTRGIARLRWIAKLIGIGACEISDRAKTERGIRRNEGSRLDAAENIPVEGFKGMTRRLTAVVELEGKG